MLHVGANSVLNLFKLIYSYIYICASNYCHCLNNWPMTFWFLCNLHSMPFNELMPSFSPDLGCSPTPQLCHVCISTVIFCVYCREVRFFFLIPCSVRVILIKLQSCEILYMPKLTRYTNLGEEGCG